MTDNSAIYNSRLIKSYVEYIKKYAPDIDIDALLKSADITMYQLNDEGHWLTQQQVDRFHAMLAEQTDIPDISREVGRFAVTSRSSGTLGYYLRSFINPATTYAVLGKINARLSRAAVMKTKSIGDNKIEVKVTLMPEAAEKQPFQCHYRLGALEAVANIFTNKLAKIEHPICIHKGGDCCLYIITWEKTYSYLWKQIRNYSFVISFTACILFLLFFQPLHWDTLVLSCILTVMGMSIYVDYLEKKELLANVRNKEDTADRLLDQIDIRYNEHLLIHEIGQATSMILEIDRLLKFIMESLEKRLDFDRGLIMLADKKKTRLVYTVSYGYHPGDETSLKGVEFHLDNPLSKGVAVEAFRKQIPILVNDINDIEKNLSLKSLSFVRAVDTKSFICAPIIYKGESMGVLLVDNLQSKRVLSQTDMSLLMGIAPQIGISINNAISYQRIRESEERFRSLSENAPDIIYTLGIRGEFTYVNPAIEKILGYSAEEVTGRYFSDLAREEDKQGYIRRFKNVRDQKRTFKDEIGILLHKDGTERSFSISGAPNLDSEGDVVGIVGIYKDVTDLFKSELELKRSFEKLQSAMSSTIDAISIIVESRDPYTAGHQKRVASLACAIAEEMKISGDSVENIRMGSLIHDIGKIYIPAEILVKPGRLTKIEFDMMKTHPTVGYNILKKVDFVPIIAQIVHQHHERMDGSGYPMGICGDDILIESRIVAVADSVEAMASHRPYRPAMGIEKALEMIISEKGKLFDSQVVDACVDLFESKGFQFPQDDFGGVALDSE